MYIHLCLLMYYLQDEPLYGGVEKKFSGYTMLY
jgi:hypothetical protein